MTASFDRVPEEPRSGVSMAVLGLWRRELVTFFRQPTRVASAVASPLVFWLVIGTGMDASFRVPGMADGGDYRAYFFPGIVVLLVLFSSVFSTITVIEDRRSGFLQGVLVAPVSRSVIVAGKVGGGAILAWLQGLVILLAAPLAGVGTSPAGLAGASGVLALLAVALTALGFSFAWVVESTQGFHGVMNLLLVPMWLLSGAFFPLAGAPVWLEALARIDPLTYGMSAFRRLLQPGVGGTADLFASIAVPLAVTVLFTLAMLGAAVTVANRERRR